jgi:hypothetical protein
MKEKNVIFSLCLVLTVLAIVVSRIQHEPRKTELFNRKPGIIVYTAEAICQKQCYGVQEKDIERVITKGIINFSRSDRNHRPCPKIVLQGLISGGQTLQVSFMQCSEKTSVLSCYVKRLVKDCPCTENDGQ